MNDFLADGPRLARLCLVFGVHPITCGDVSSDTLEIHGLIPPGLGAEEDAVGSAKTFPDLPCVSPNAWRPIFAAPHS